MMLHFIYKKVLMFTFLFPCILNMLFLCRSTLKKLKRLDDSNKSGKKIEAYLFNEIHCNISLLAADAILLINLPL